MLFIVAGWFPRTNPEEPMARTIRRETPRPYNKERKDFRKPLERSIRHRVRVVLHQTHDDAELREEYTNRTPRTSGWMTW